MALSLTFVPTTAQSPAQLKIATVVWIGYGPLCVADALDLYKKYNLKVSLQLFNDPALIPAAIASGAVAGGMPIRPCVAQVQTLESFLRPPTPRSTLTMAHITQSACQLVPTSCASVTGCT